MNRIGHIGVSLLVFSPLVLKFDISVMLFVIFLTIAPDVDLLFKVEHRKYTHNITFAFFISTLVFFTLKSTILSLLVFLSILLHIAVDLLTVKKFAPFYPFSKKKYAFGLFKSNNKVINYSSFLIGLFLFVYLSKILSFEEIAKLVKFI